MRGLHGWFLVRYALFGDKGAVLHDKRTVSVFDAMCCNEGTQLRVFNSPFLLKAIENRKRADRLDAELIEDDKEVVICCWRGCWLV